MKTPQIAPMPASYRLPHGWTWDDVSSHRAKYDIGEDMVPIATAPGCAAWGTINSVWTESGLTNPLHEDQAALARIKANAPLKPKQQQVACDHGLFSDQAAQIDLIEMLQDPAED